MPKFVVYIQRTATYEVNAEDAGQAEDMALTGEAEELDSTTNRVWSEEEPPEEVVVVARGMAYRTPEKAARLARLFLATMREEAVGKPPVPRR